MCSSDLEFPFFIAGMLAYRIWESDQFAFSILKGAFLIVSTILIIAFLVITSSMSSNIIPHFFYRGHLWALAFISFLLSICYWPNSFFNNRIMGHLGSISYSLYLLHPFVIVVFMFCGLYDAIYTASGSNQLGFIISLIITFFVVILMSSFSYKYIEKPGMALRKRLVNRWRTQNNSFLMEANTPSKIPDLSEKHA